MADAEDVNAGFRLVFALFIYCGPRSCIIYNTPAVSIERIMVLYNYELETILSCIYPC